MPPFSFVVSLVASISFAIVVKVLVFTFYPFIPMKKRPISTSYSYYPSSPKFGLNDRQLHRFVYSRYKLHNIMKNGISHDAIGSIHQCCF